MRRPKSESAPMTLFLCFHPDIYDDPTDDRDTGECTLKCTTY